MYNVRELTDQVINGPCNPKTLSRSLCNSLFPELLERCLHERRPPSLLPQLQLRDGPLGGQDDGGDGAHHLPQVRGMVD